MDILLGRQRSLGQGFPAQGCRQQVQRPPISFEELRACISGCPRSMGSSFLDGTRAQNDSTLAARFRQAGFISFARSTVPEMCMAPTTEARRNGGPTRNPFDFERSLGASSGGAAVAVACRVVPIAREVPAGRRRWKL
ncbi:hypothetical protein J6524_34990 [Bradyrhizobium sp. WSM 1738]|nr:hypothetical protein [Bradyrhizobium hereditatis]